MSGERMNRTNHNQPRHDMTTINGPRYPSWDRDPNKAYSRKVLAVCLVGLGLIFAVATICAVVNTLAKSAAQ